jgi:hypothetical protein
LLGRGFLCLETQQCEVITENACATKYPTMTLQASI